MTPAAALRRRLGRMAAGFGLAYLLPTGFVWLSSGGPAPVSVAPRAWSLFFFAHFAALVLSGLAVQAAESWRSGLFHGGPLVDFVLAVVAFMLLESAAAEFVRAHAAFWTMLVPGAVLLGFGLRLSTGAPLLRA